MTDLLSTKYIFIDTSVFESENFIEGNKIKKLFDFANKRQIEIILPEIIRREVIARMRINLRIAKSYVEKHRKDIYSHINILRNIASYESKFPLPEVNIKNDAAALENLFDQLLKHGKAQVISGPIDHNLIFDKYFNDQPPFNKESKKHEFPMPLHWQWLNNGVRKKMSPVIF